MTPEIRQGKDLGRTLIRSLVGDPLKPAPSVRAGGEGKPVASLSREAVTTSKSYPGVERFISYDVLPF